MAQSIVIGGERGWECTYKGKKTILRQEFIGGVQSIKILLRGKDIPPNKRVWVDMPIEECEKEGVAKRGVFIDKNT